MGTRESVTRKELNKFEMLPSGSSEEQWKGYSELSIGENWFQASPQSLQQMVQDLTKKLSKANEALRREIAERRQKEAASYDNETRYRSILKNLQD